MPREKDSERERERERGGRQTVEPRNRDREKPSVDQNRTELQRVESRLACRKLGRRAIVVAFGVRSHWRHTRL
ncbi:hypothetical protein Mapa_003536 [Marchantia paleacea]|nr:hypothetical protein Mapa_003536 [Marchantia paleacea]